MSKIQGDNAPLLPFSDAHNTHGYIMWTGLNEE